MNNQILNSGFFKQLDFLIHGGDEFQSMIIWKKHHAGMRMKRKQHAFSINILGNFVQSVNDFSVPYMNPIKRAGCNNRTFNFLKFFYGMKNLQPFCFELAKIFKYAASE